MAEENENLEDEDFENQVLPLEVVELIVILFKNLEN